MKMHNRLIGIAVFIVLLGTQIPLAADTKDTEKKDHTPVPYTKEEFPLWQRELRRFEILAFGALPFVTMLSFWGYDMIRSAKHPKDPAYYPWPLKSPDKAVPLTEKEQREVFFTAVGLSIGVALIDITYRAIKRAVEKKRLERQNLYADEPITFTPTNLPLDDEDEKGKTDQNTPAQQADSAIPNSGAPADTAAAGSKTAGDQQAAQNNLTATGTQENQSATPPVNTESRSSENRQAPAAAQTNEVQKMPAAAPAGVP